MEVCRGFHHQFGECLVVDRRWEVGSGALLVASEGGLGDCILLHIDRIRYIDSKTLRCDTKSVESLSRGGRRDRAAEF